MLCACSGERHPFDEWPQSPESLATRDFSDGCHLSDGTGGANGGGRGDRASTALDDSRVDDVVESTLKETISLNYEEARALLGRLEYQRGNFDAALQVLQGIDVRRLRSRMIRTIAERTRLRKARSKRGGGEVSLENLMSMNSVSLLVEAMLLKCKSLEGLGQFKDAALECKSIVDIIEAAWPHGTPEGVGHETRLKDMFHQALELFPKLWKQAGSLEEAIIAYRRALSKHWKLDSKRLTSLQKELAVVLLYSGVEGTFSPPIEQLIGHETHATNIEEAIILLMILMKKMAMRETSWDPEIINHLTYGLSLTGQFELLASHVEEIIPGIHSRLEQWYLLALCYGAGGVDNAAINVLSKMLGYSQRKSRAHLPSLLLGAKLCCKYPRYAHQGLKFALKAFEVVSKENNHFAGIASHLLGVCYGYCAKCSVSDSQRLQMQYKSLKSLQHAATSEKDDPEVIYSLSKENAIQRNLNEAKENASRYLDLVGRSSVNGWKLLSLVVSAEQNLKEAEEIVDIALDEVGKVDQLDFLHLKALLQVAQELPNNAIETYKVLLSMLQARKELKTWSSTSEVQLKAVKNTEKESWLDLAAIYMKLGSWNDSRICLERANSVEPFSPEYWHAKGMLLEAQSLQKEALMSYLTSLSIKPDYPPGMVSVAAIISKFGENLSGIAKSFLMNALLVDPTNHEAWLNLGYISKKEGLLEQAADCFQAAYELRQSCPVQNFTTFLS